MCKVCRLCMVCEVYMVCVYIVGDLELSWYSRVLTGLRQAVDLYVIVLAYFYLFSKC